MARGDVRREVPTARSTTLCTAKAASAFLGRPQQGRVFSAQQRVRAGDTTPSGRARLDSLARYVVDVADDDAGDAGWPGSAGWVVRRTVMVVRRYPALGEALLLETFCSAIGPRWAERTTTISAGGEPVAQACAAWVALDPATGRPVPLGELFQRVYGPSAAGRRASARLHLPPPPPGATAGARPWPLRAIDFDAWRHVNNVVSWAAVEEELAAAGWPPARAEVEYNGAIGPGAAPRLASIAADGTMDLWLLDGGQVLTSAHLERAGARGS
ncbi:MAG: acyl-ACP thioesterase domain-containing protein [Acidimicrobiales bacterium]